MQSNFEVVLQLSFSRLLNINLNSEQNKQKKIKYSKKIIYAWNYIEWGGAQIYFLGLIRRIKEFVDIKIVLPKNSDQQLLTFIKNLGVEYEFFDAQADSKPAKTLSRKLKRHFNKYKAEKALVDHLEKNDLKNSIVHVELAPWQSLLPLIRLCKKTDVFITMHNSLPPVPNWRYKLWQRKFSKITNYSTFHIFTSNKDAKNSLKTLVPESFYEKIKVTYTNVNPDKIKEALALDINKTELLEKHNIPQNKFLIFCVGQFIDRKGRWTFLEAAKNVFEVDQDFAFVWISNSKPSAEDLNKAESYGLGKNFVLITSEQVGTEHIDLFRFIRVSDAFALVSFQEGLPIALLEAMSLGIPSISTNVNAIPEAVKHLETGWLIEAGDSKHLKKAFQELKNDPILCEKLAEAGKKFVLEKFNEIEVAQIALDEYKKVLK